MPKTKHKIWKEWEELPPSSCYPRYWVCDIYPNCLYASIFQNEENGKYYFNYSDFKTKKAAMLKAQSLILKEYREIQQVMRDKT